MKGHLIFVCSVFLHVSPDVSSQFLQPPFPFPGAPQMGMPIPMPAPPMGPIVHPMPLQAPMPFPMMPQQKLPVVVMPYYSKSADRLERKQKKKRRKKHPRRKVKKDSSCSSESSSSSSSSDSSEDFNFRAKRGNSSKKHRRPVLTPVVSYVTKDGYVVYQKKIKKEKAKDWLDMKRPNPMLGNSNEDRPNGDSGQQALDTLEAKYRQNKKRGRSHHH